MARFSALMERRTPRARALVTVVAALAIAAVLLVGMRAAFASHPEVSLPNSNFEIDTNANLKVDDPAPSIDWAAPSVTETRKADKLTGSGDDSFGQGTKEDTAVPTVINGSIPPNKSDLLNFGVYLETNANGKFLNVFWHRVQEPSGTTNMDFEFNKSSTISGNGVTPVRTAGDVLIQYDLSQGGTNPQLFLSRWVTSGASSECEASNSTPCWSDRVNLTAQGDATGSINTTAIPAAQSEGLGNVSARTFGEAQIDFDALTGGSGASCESFAGAYLKSRSSDSFTAAMKDFIAPEPLNLSNCGQVIIRKQTDPDKTVTDPDPTFGYTHNVNIEGTTDPTTFNLQDDGVQTINDVLQGSYQLTEDATLPAGWEFVNVNCSASSGVTVDTTAAPQIKFTIDSATDVVDCTYNNRQLTSTLGTEQSFIPQDTATVGGTPSTGFDGTADFRLYAGDSCSGDSLFEQLNVALNGNTAGSKASTNNDGTPTAGTKDGYTITGTGGTFSWKVTYEGDTNTDGAQHPNTESCVEESAVTIDNDNTKP
jgi:hypothetical protein